MKVDKNRIYLEASEASGQRHAKYNLYTSLTHHYLMVDQTSRRLMVTSDDERDIPAIAGWQVFLYCDIRDAVTLPPIKEDSSRVLTSHRDSASVSMKVINSEQLT